MTGLSRRHAVVGAAAALLLASAPAALAHHSFAVFFSSDQEVVSVTGSVTSYRFTNPHGFIELIAKTREGGQEHWGVETNSPSVLRRRGWDQDSIKPGEIVTVQGWRARDGTRFMRLKAAFRADGSQIGKPGSIDGGKS